MKKIKLNNYSKQAVIIMIINCICHSFLHADGGYISSNNILVYEPSQSAVIGWNGYKESLVLSTNLYTNSEMNDWAIEMIPFPSLPEIPRNVSLDIFHTANEMIESRIGKHWSGDVNCDFNIDIIDALMVAQYYSGIKPKGFYKITADVDGDQDISIVDALLIAQYYVGFSSDAWGGKINGINVAFQDQIGMHHVTVVESENAAQLITLAEQVLSKESNTENIQWRDLKSIAADYIDRGMRYWVIDLLDLSSDEKSRDPLIYTFRSDSLYFPLVISSLNAGESLIDLITITINELDQEGIMAAGFEGIPIDTYFNIHTPELLEQLPAFMEIFGAISMSPLKIARHYYQGPLSALNKDLITGIRR